METTTQPEAKRPRWHPAVRIALYLVVYAVLQTAAALTVAVPWVLRTGSAATVPTEALLATFLLFAPLMYLATRGLARTLDRRTMADLGVRRPAGGGTLRRSLVAAAGTALLLGGWLAVAVGARAVRIEGLSADFLAGPGFLPGTLGGALLLAGLLAIFLVQGSLEELAFRGYVYRALRERLSPRSAALLQALLFAGAHFVNGGLGLAGFLNTFLIGLVLVLLVDQRGSLLAASVAHGVWNFTVACLVSLPVSDLVVFHLLDARAVGPVSLTGGAYGPEGSWLLTPFVFAALVLVRGLAPPAKPEA